MAVDNKQIAIDVLAAVGGKDNVTSALHCMTRLRLVLKDFSIPNLDEIKKIDGVLGAQVAGGQLQVIIGQNVPKVYKEVCEMTGLQSQKALEENLDAPKEKLTWKKVGSNILDYLSGSMIPIIPAMIAGSLLKTVSVILGPGTFNLIAADSNFMVLCDFMYDACFYFLPIYLGYNAAKKLGIPPILGAFTGAALISPDFINIVTNAQPFSIYGLNVPLNNYSQSVFPALLSVYALSIIYKAVNKVMPETITTVFTPLVSMLILLPLEFCLLAPAGSYLGNFIGAILVWIANNLGFVGLGILAALWNFCIITGMHVVIYLAVLPAVMAVGFDTAAMPAFTIAGVAVWGMCVGAALKLKDKKERSLAWSYFISAAVGGVSEPALYGLCFKYKKPFVAIAVGGFAGGVVGGILKTVSYLGGGSSNFTVFIPYLQGGVGNLVKILVASLVAAVVAGIVTYVLGFDEKGVKSAE